MAKGAASEGDLGKLHSRLTSVFQKVLERYCARLDALDKFDPDDFGEEFATELFEEGAIPNPAMLNAIAAFLKNNEIRFADEQVDKLSAMKQALEQRREKRQNVVELRNVKAVGDD